jgi:hypothetical protein
MEKLQDVVTTVDADVLNRVRGNAVLLIDACHEMDGGRFKNYETPVVRSFDRLCRFMATSVLKNKYLGA